MLVRRLLPLLTLLCADRWQAAAEPIAVPRRLQAAAVPGYQHQPPPQHQYAYQQQQQQPPPHPPQPVYQYQAQQVPQGVPVQQVPPGHVPPGHVQPPVQHGQVPPQVIQGAYQGQAVPVPPIPAQPAPGSVGQAAGIPVPPLPVQAQAAPQYQQVPGQHPPHPPQAQPPVQAYQQVPPPQAQHMPPPQQVPRPQAQQVPPQAQQAPPPQAQQVRPPQIPPHAIPQPPIPGNLPQQAPVNAEFVQAVQKPAVRPPVPEPKHIPHQVPYVKQPQAIPMNDRPMNPQPYEGDVPMDRVSNVTSENLAAQWEQVMQDFMPDMIVTFRLQGGDSEYFHIDVDTTLPLIRGGFFESSDGKAGSGTFSVVGPDGKLLYGSKQGEGLFSINSTTIGTYTFGMVAAPWSGTKFVTFVLGTGQANRLTSDEVQTIEGRVQAMFRQVQVVESQAQYLWVRQQNMLKDMNNTASQTYYALVLELLCTATATALAAMFIKRTVAKRGVL